MLKSVQILVSPRFPSVLAACVTVIAALGTLAGCGQKGPLYLPAPAATAQAPAIAASAPAPRP